MKTSIHCLRGRMRNRPGQGLVEFVLVAPLLLLLIFGLIEFARAWNIRHVVTDAAREGARNLAVDNTLTMAEIRTKVETALSAAGLNPANATIDLVPCASASCASPNTRETGKQARVTINYPYDLGMMRVMLGWAVTDSKLDIGTTFVMRNE